MCAASERKQEEDQLWKGVARVSHGVESWSVIGSTMCQGMNVLRATQGCASGGREVLLDGQWSPSSVPKSSFIAHSSHVPSSAHSRHVARAAA